MSYANLITEDVKKYPELEIIDAQKVYKEKFNSISEQAFYKTFSRLTKTGELYRLTKGIYCIPKTGRFGTVVSNEKNILEYYLGTKRNKGVIIGYRLYNKYGLTTQVAKQVEIYSSVTLQEKKQIRDVLIYKLNVRFDETTIRMIELLEVLQNHNKIEELNTNRLIYFIKDFITYYDENVLRKLIKSIGYKKNTLASLKSILDYHAIQNSVNNYLNGTSKYNELTMDDLNEFASSK